MQGQERIGDARTTSGAWRGAAGIDWVVSRLHGNDLVLATEAQYARTTLVEARALMFELVLVGI
jgi:hypothetical protein